MITPAFSTVACPDRTLADVAALAETAGFPAVELRTFGIDSRTFACDPALTCPDKTRRIFAERGVAISSLATGIVFHAPVNPPVLGVLLDNESAVRDGKRAIELATQLACPYIRVFANDIPPRQTRSATLARVVKRLAMVVEHAHNTPVRVLIENAGAFPTADDLLEIVERIDNNALAVCYALAPAVAAGDDPINAVSRLRSRLGLVRIKDLDDAGRPCRLATGTLPTEEFVTALAGTGYAGSLVFEWDRAWFPDLEEPDAVLADAARTLFGWIGHTHAAHATREPVHA